MARATGTTVRALRHYDEIGLLRAGDRTASGHRRYTERDVRRLYRIRALRALGLPLTGIAEVLGSSVEELSTMRDLLATQLRDLGRQAERIRMITHQIQQLLHQIDDAEMPDPDQFLTTLEMISVFDSYFTSDQQAQLAERRAGLGPDAIEAAKTRWTGLVEELLHHVQADTPVDDHQVQSLVRRWNELGAAFHTGEHQTEAAARRMWQDNSAEISRALPWSHEQMTALVVYLDRARQSA
jgi:DNA-binding transcriptional MerR regulator